MTSVEKRRSRRKSGGHRKHSDGGYSDTSSGGSFLDETDREVSNLTDRAFRSLCIGDEAVYNDSDLCSSSPCSQRDRQLAFSQSGQDRESRDREREELKRAAHESFTVRVQQYGQDWIHGGMYGTEIHRGPQWEIYGERTQGKVSTTFQHSFVETSQQEKTLREEQLSFLSNGAMELSSQQRRSRSRVSSLIRAFNSEGHRDGAEMDGKLREWNDETSWDKSALMSIQRELSEFSTPLQQNFNSDNFPSAGPFLSQDTSFYSSEVAAVAHMNSASSLMSASHSKHSMSTQVNCNSNFFIHSEFSPFKVWRDHNRFPFHQGKVSGFMQCSEFPKWYETPMYKELSLEAQPQGPYRLEERGIRHPRNNMVPMVSPTHPCCTSISTVLQKASAVEKRSESELAGHYPHRKWTQSLGANRFQSQRPSTASPTIEMSRRVRDTISSVKALQQKIKMMTEQNMETGMTANKLNQGGLCSNDNLIPIANNAVTVSPNVVKSNTSRAPFNISQILTPSVEAHQETETSEVQQFAVSPQPVEHPPVRAESRGATPDVRMSSYKSRATSLLFNLKDNRKRVKNTYSPTKFKGLEKLEKTKQSSIQEPRDTVIDIPDFPDPDIQFTQVEESKRTNAASHQYVNQYQSPGFKLYREAEQIRRERIKTEQVETEHRKLVQAKQEQIKEQQAKTEQEKMNLVEMVKVSHIKAKDVRQDKAAENSIQAGQLNAEQPTTQISKAKEAKVVERKAEQTKLEQTILDLAKAELTKTRNLEERLPKLAAKLSVIQQVKSEPDKVEQVKTGLANTKAELAKINEKMRGEPKENIRNTIIKYDILKKDVPLRVNMNKNEDYKKRDRATQMHQQKEDSVVNRNSRDQTDRGADDYDCLRQKYGFTNAGSTNRNKVSTAGNDFSNDANEMPPSSLNKGETGINEKSKDEHSPASGLETANTEDKKEVCSFKSNEMTDSQYVYSESSKEFKLSSADYVPTRLDNRANCDTVTYKVEDESVEKLEKCDPVSQQRDSALTKFPPLERKPKSTEHSVGSGKDLHFTPPRALSHKERAQTKQEILTSKIKAHAEKEISAIKGKGFAIRDGFMSKNPTKQLAGSQSINIRNRPQSQEVSKKHESIMSSNITPKHQMEPSGIQMEPVKSVSPSSSATISVKSAATTGQLIDHSQKQVPPTDQMEPSVIQMKTVKSVSPSSSATISVKSAAATGQLVDHSQKQVPLTDQMEPSGIQMKPVKSVSPSSSATISVKSAATTGQIVDHSQKQVPKVPVKINDNVTEPPTDAKQIGSYTKRTDKGLVENQKTENQSGISLPMQSKEQAPKNNQGKQEANHGANSGKHIEGLKDNPAISNDHLNKKKEDSLQATALIKDESFKSMKPEKPESKHEAATSPNLVFTQNKTPLADDSLQIMGIMVTVQERKPSDNNGQGDNSTQEQINTKEKECSNSELNKWNPSSGLEVSEENKSSKEVCIAKAKHRVVQETHSTVKEDQTNIGMNNHPENVQETSTLETRKNNVSENVNEKRTNLQESSSINTRPQRETQLQKPFAEKGVPPTVIVPAKNNVLGETQTLLCKQDIIIREMKDYSNKTPKENLAKGIRKDELKKNTEEKIPQKTSHTNENFMAKMENTRIHCNNDSNRADAEALIKHDVQLSVTENMTTVKNPPKSESIDGKSAPLLEEKSYDSTPLKPLDKTTPFHHSTENKNRHVSPKLQYKETHIGEYNQVDDDIHIDSIDIRVLPAVTEKDNLKMAGEHHVTTVPSDVVVANEHKKVASSSCEEKVNTSNNEDRTKDLTPACNKKQLKDNLEDKLGLQHMLSSVREGSDSLKISNQQSSINGPTENIQAENGKPEKVKESWKSVDESKIQAMEEGYFQVQGTAETNNEPHNCANVGETLAGVSNARELPGCLPNKAVVSNESYKEGKNGVFVLDQSKRKTVESSSVSVQNETTENNNWETEDKMASKQSDGPTEKQSKSETMEAGQANPIKKHHALDQSSLSARERQTSKNSHLIRENVVKEKPEIKLKPKERVSTIPEISAIADYARLKVIVSEERANTIQEFPPNKKEGFFPLIQTRHSRRPVFTADPKDISVKEKSLPKKTAVSAKIIKGPKALVFPITEKEHQRTGMFKLGDNERQEKMVLDATGVLDAGAKHAQHLEERNKSPTTYFQNQETEEKGAGRLCQVNQSIHQRDNSALQATTSSSAVNRPRNASVSHLKSLDNSNPHENPEEFSSKAERIPFLDKNSHQQSTLGQMHNLEESTTTLRKDEKIENKLAKSGEERKEKLRQERLATKHEATTAKQSEEEQSYRIEEEKRAEDMTIKHMIEESKASLAEEEWRATQREEERRAKEREAIATKIKEKRKKQEEEIRAKQREQERRVKEIEEKRIKTEEERRAKLRGEEVWTNEHEERKRLKQQEEERAAKVEQQRKAALEKQQRRAAQEERQKRAAEEEQQRRAELEERQRKAALEEQQKRAAEDEQLSKTALEEQQQKAALGKQQSRGALVEHQRRAAQEERQKRAAEEEQQRRASQEERQKRAAEEEEQRKTTLEEQQKRAALEKQQSKAAQEEQQKTTALEEQHGKVELDEQQKRAAQKEQQMRTSQEEQQRRAALEEQQRRAALIEEQRRAKQIEEKILAKIEEEKKRTQREVEERKAEKEKTIIKQREERQGKEEMTRQLEESQAALKEEEKRVAREQMLSQREREI
ncbi:uncharacterized protein LOC120796693 [Xiphias gladius]|uniref:uncharacterized protein LOC120796693 n=1 Tax=Xiphias gladius TaxID=8245 RepID=UPI001A9A06CD|nr:uncharacterized protein LOC120796693 [Xiphias gladius]